MLAPPTVLSNTARSILQLPLLDIWRASELAVSRATTCPTGHPLLDEALPGNGWPRSMLVELLLQQSGIGEMQLLKPTLARLSKHQRIAFVQPPFLPHAKACETWGIDTSRILWIRAKSTADALWSAEQILKNGSCGALILWQTHVRAESLRRLNLAAQTAHTWFWLMRPMACAADASPAPLRLALRPALASVSIDIIKRRGPRCDTALFVALPDMPAGRHPLEHDYGNKYGYEHEHGYEHANAISAEPASAAVAARSAAPALV